MFGTDLTAFTAINPIDQFEYVSSSSEEWRIINKQDAKLKYHKSNLSKKGNDTEHNSFLELCSALILISFFRY
jgi:hypothetical protein